MTILNFQLLNCFKMIINIKLLNIYILCLQISLYIRYERGKPSDLSPIFGTGNSMILERPYNYTLDIMYGGLLCFSVIDFRLYGKIID